MGMRIVVHSGQGAPKDAIDQLAPVLGRRRGEVSFTPRGREIRVKMRREEGSRLEREERAGADRLALLELLEDVCSNAPQLSIRWYAVTNGED